MSTSRKDYDTFPTRDLGRTVPRFRQMGGLRAMPGLNYAIVSYGPTFIAPFSGVVSVGSHEGNYKYIADMVTKGFRKTSDFRKWVSHPYSVGLISAKASQFMQVTTNNPTVNGSGLQRTWSGDGVGYLFGPLVPAPSSISFGSYPDLVNVDNLTKIAIVKCLNRINPVKSQSLVTAAEAEKSVTMILDRAKKLALFYVAFKRGDRRLLDKISGKKSVRRIPKRYVMWDNNGQPITRKNGKPSVRYGHASRRVVDSSKLTDAARLELEYRYGWTPLVHDIVDSLKAITAEDLRKELTVPDFIRVFDVVKDQSVSTTPLATSKDGGAFGGLQTLTHKVEVKAYAKFRYLETSGILFRMQEFGLFDVPRAAWDLVPLSFVADWVIPVGSWLAAVTPKVGVDVIESGVSLLSSKEVTRTLTSYSSTQTGVGAWPSSPITLGISDSFVTQEKRRTLGLPLPLLPPTEVKINFKRMLDAVALLRVMR